MKDLPGPVIEALRDPENHMGKYIRVRRLGSGGMGEVWRAWEKDLRRWVALKFLLGDDPEELARFQREAQTAAKLNHPNIGAVYEVGEHEGRPYISMQLIEGRTLASDDRDPVARIRDAARAVHTAHGQGIIHRDLKPANIMVDDSNRVFVMDFGLAKEMKSDLSLSGSILGTPAFMPPEQAQGRTDDVSPQSDVYSLGATLYALLAGRPPFDSTNAYDVLRQVVEQDPLPVPGVDPELNTILMMCLEKNPKQRYADAAALADDLTRHLEGEPIEAHPPGLLYRMRKRIAKRKALAITVVAAMVIAGTVAAVLVPALLKVKSELSETREDLLQQMREISNAYLELALAARRADDTDKMNAAVPRVEEVCRNVIARLPDLAEPHYRLGRMYRALMRDEDALREQTEAVRKDASYSPARYERVVLMAREYRHKTRELRWEAIRKIGAELAARSGGDVPAGELTKYPSRHKAAGEDEEARRLLAVMEEDLRFLTRESRSMTEAQRKCVQGLYQWAIDHGKKAKPLLRDAARLDPEREEAYSINGLIELDLFHYDHAVKWLTSGIDRDRGFVRHYEDRGYAWWCWGEKDRQEGKNPLKKYEHAVRDFTEVIRRHPKSAEAWRNRGRARSSSAEFRHAAGEVVWDGFDDAIADYGEAIRLDPGNANAWKSRGVSLGNLGNRKDQIGEDPVPLFESAIADLSESIRIDPGKYPAWKARGVVRSFLGRWQMRESRNPTDVLEAAAEDFAEALRLNPGWHEIWWRRGLVRVHLVEYRRRRGIDTGTLVEEALVDFQEAIRLQPRQSPVWKNRAMGLGLLAVAGIEPEKNLRQAVEDYGKALQFQKDDVTLWSGRGKARVNLGNFLGQRGRDVTNLYREAIRDFDEGLNRNPKSRECLSHRARAYGNLAWYLGVSGRDPSDAFRKSVQEFERAIRMTPGDDLNWDGRGAVYMNWALHRARKNQDPTEQYESAIADYRESVKRKPRSAQSLTNLGGCYVNLGQYKARTGMDPGDLYRMGIEHLDNALRWKPRSVTAWQFRAIARYSWMAWKRGQGHQALDLAYKCLKDYEHFVKLQPSSRANAQPRIDYLKQILGEK